MAACFKVIYEIYIVYIYVIFDFIHYLDLVKLRLTLDFYCDNIIYCQR